MTTTKRVLSLGLAAILVATAPLGAFTLIELLVVQVPSGDSFRTHVRLSQVLLGDGSVRFLPGEYDVEVLSKGDGSVRASFFDKSGRKAGEASGVVAVLKQGQAALKQGEAAPPAGANVPRRAGTGGRRPEGRAVLAIRTGRLELRSSASDRSAGRSSSIRARSGPPDRLQGREDQILIGLLVPRPEGPRGRREALNPRRRAWPSGSARRVRRGFATLGWR
jgi:hypothetical protein